MNKKNSAVPLKAPKPPTKRVSASARAEFHRDTLKLLVGLDEVRELAAKEAAKAKRAKPPAR